MKKIISNIKFILTAIVVYPAMVIHTAYKLSVFKQHLKHLRDSTKEIDQEGYDSNRDSND